MMSWTPCSVLGMAGLSMYTWKVMALRKEKALSKAPVAVQRRSQSWRMPSALDWASTPSCMMPMAGTGKCARLASYMPCTCSDYTFFDPDCSVHALLLGACTWFRSRTHVAFSGSWRMFLVLNHQSAHTDHACPQQGLARCRAAVLLRGPRWSRRWGVAVLPGREGEAAGLARSHCTAQRPPGWHA